MKRRVFAFILAMFIAFSCVTSSSATANVDARNTVPNLWATAYNNEAVTASDTYILYTFFDYDFYSHSLVKQFTLDKYCVSITYRALCNDGSYDAMYLIITDLNGGSYNKRIDIEADGLSHTVPLYLPAGTYKAQAVGNIKLHTRIAVNFYGYV